MGEEYVESLIVYPQNLTVVIVAYDRWRAKCLPSKILFPTWSPHFAPVFPLVHRILQATHLRACLPPLLIMPPMGGIHIPGTVSGLVLNSSVSPSIPTGTVDPTAHFRHSSVGTPASTYMGPPTSTGFVHNQNPADPFRPYTSNTRVQPIGMTHTTQNSGSPAPSRFPAALEEASRRQNVSAIPSNNSGWQSPARPRNEGPKHPTRHMSLPPSRAGSMGPPDIFGPEEIINPLGEMSNMAGLVEAAVERAREEQAAQSKAPTPLILDLESEERRIWKAARH